MLKFIIKECLISRRFSVVYDVKGIYDESGGDDRWKDEYELLCECGC